MPLEREAIRKALCHKGFVEDPGSDHCFLTLWIDGKQQPIFTKLSRGSKYKTYDDSLIALMSRRLFLSKKDFVALVSCELSESQYIAKLKRTGHV